jgi:hypothetical protein
LILPKGWLIGFVGEAFNAVDDLLSDAHSDVNFDGTRMEDSCPLN